MPRNAAVATQDLEVTQPQPRVQKGTGPAEKSLSPEKVDAEPKIAVASNVDSEWVANMEFMREKITVRVDEAEDENAEKVVTVWNNGDPMHFPRGKEVTCERRFVETLMRAKPTKYSQKAVLDDLGKVGAYAEIPHRALRYHFSVVEDKNPLGRQWLKVVLAQG
jgi:hypothetical protein